MKKKAMSIYLNQMQSDFVKDRAAILGISPPEYIRQLIDKRIELYISEEVDLDVHTKNKLMRKKELIKE